jgi:hypothetical protein
VRAPASSISSRRSFARMACMIRSAASDPQQSQRRSSPAGAKWSWGLPQTGHPAWAGGAALLLDPCVPRQDGTRPEG